MNYTTNMMTMMMMQMMSASGHSCL